MAFNRLYIHVPFCSSKCGYCAFYSETDASEELIQAYLKHLEEEFSANFAKCSELDSIFIGGGTPTFLSSANLEQLFNMIFANFAISENAEISIESNPESLDADKVSIIANFANRVSLGIQSFNCEFRNILERRGTIGSVLKGIDLIKNSGIKNFGCDLIYSIPGQTLDDWEIELKEAVEIGVRHISAYSLTYEEGTRITENRDRAKDVSPLDNSELSVMPSRQTRQAGLEADMWEMAGEFLKTKGIPRYEVSNYAMPGFECKHNREIWYGDTYLGCGPAATSFDGKDRYSNPSDLKAWLAGEETEKDVISAEKRAAEILAMGLRTSQGWDLEKFQERTGFNITRWEPSLKEAECEGLVKLSELSVVPTEKGLILWDDLAGMLI